jgi:hypothetical protein
MLSFKRPKPKFEIGAIVRCIHTISIETRFILITYRRWVQPESEREKQWVYDGILLRTEGTEIVPRGSASCTLEDIIEYVCGPRVMRS